MDISADFTIYLLLQIQCDLNHHDDVMKWKHFPRYWPFVWGIHRSPVNSTHKGQLRRALMFSSISAWTNGWVTNGEAGDLRRHRAHYNVNVMRGKQRQAIRSLSGNRNFPTGSIHKTLYSMILLGTFLWHNSWYNMKTILDFSGMPLCDIKSYHSTSVTIF